MIGLVGCVIAAPQTGYNYNQNRNKPYAPLGVQPLIRPQQQFNPAPTQQVFNQAASRNFVPITSYTNEINYDGSFQYSYTTGDGQAAQAQGYVKNPGNKDLEAQVVQGSYSYTSPEGLPITVNYIADENGFRAEGAHLPTPPPIPEAIAKSLQLIAKTQPATQNNLAYNQQYQQSQYSTNSQNANNQNGYNNQGGNNKYGRY